jgi:uncharacterized protein (DUF2062 family)
VSEPKKEHSYRPIRRAYQRFLKIRGKPREIALGFALGVFIGLTPTMGVQTPLAILIAAVLKWSKLGGAAGVWITNPLTAPVIYSATYLVGTRILGNGPLPEMPADAGFDVLKELLLRAPQVLLTLLLGGIVIGLPLATGAYYLSFFAVRRYQEKIQRRLERQKERLRRSTERLKARARPRRHHVPEASEAGRRSR